MSVYQAGWCLKFQKQTLKFWKFGGFAGHCQTCFMSNYRQKVQPSFSPMKLVMFKTTLESAELPPTSPSAGETKMVKKRITGAMAAMATVFQRWSQNRYIENGDPLE